MYNSSLHITPVIHGIKPRLLIAKVVVAEVVYAEGFGAEGVFGCEMACELSRVKRGMNEEEQKEQRKKGSCRVKSEPAEAPSTAVWRVLR